LASTFWQATSSCVVAAFNVCHPYHVAAGRRSSRTIGPATPRPSACTLQHITVRPSKISDIARAALVLTHFEHGYIP
jgi:hypothetical protein